MPYTRSFGPTTSAIVGRIQYLNTDPFFEGLELDSDPVVVPPRELARLCREGSVDVGPVPVVEWFDMEDEFEPLGDMGIATFGPVQSVLLFSRRPLEELDGAVVGITSESSTSIRLLRLVLEQRHGVHPVDYLRGAGADAAVDAFLTIGDDALRRGQAGEPGFPHVVDLCEAWGGWQRLPFVFARWIIRRALPAAEKRRMLDAFEASLSLGLDRLGDIAARRAGAMGLSADTLEHYLRRFHYRFGPAEERAEALFKGLLNEHDLLRFDPR